MSEKKCLLIINPISGTRNKRGLDKFVKEELSPNGYEVDAYWTRSHGDAAQSARKGVDEDYDLIIAAGGDGTVNEVASVVRDSGTAFGIIPCGSGNGLARHLGIPTDIRASVEIIKGGEVTDCDYGTANGKPFFCTFGMGFDAVVSRRFSEKSKRGMSSYVKSVRESMKVYKGDEFGIEIGGKLTMKKAFILTVCNGSQYGNDAYIAPRASITDGELDVVIVEGCSSMSKLLMGMELMSGLIDKNSHVRVLRTPSLMIRREREGVCHLDGDPTEMGKDIEIKCHAGGIRIITGGVIPRVYPFVSPLKSVARTVKYKVKKIFSNSNL